MSHIKVIIIGATSNMITVLQVVPGDFGLGNSGARIDWGHHGGLWPPIIAM